MQRTKEIKDLEGIQEQMKYLVIEKAQWKFWMIINKICEKIIWMTDRLTQDPILPSIQNSNMNFLNKSSESQDNDSSEVGDNILERRN